MALGAAFTLTTVITRIFWTHSLKEILTSNQLASFETGVRHQMYHEIILIFIGLAFV